VRTFHLLRGLSTAHEVTLASEAPDSGVDATSVRNLCKTLHLVPQRSRGMAGEMLTLVHSLAANIPFLLQRHHNSRLDAAVRRLLEDSEFDAIHLNHLDAALYLQGSRKPAVVVLDEHNIVSNQAFTTLASEKRGLVRLLLKMELPKLRRAEGLHATTASHVLVCSPEDQRHLKKFAPAANSFVVPNGVDLDHFGMLDPTHARPGTLLFIGAMDYEPCDRAMRHFCSHILPVLRRHAPDARIVIVGRNPSSALQRIAELDAGIILTGRVPDVRKAAATAQVFVVPLLSGSGTRLKILEAMAMGIPIVTTSVGLEGIAAIHGQHCLVADEPEAFAAAVNEVLCNEVLARRLALAARRLVENQYGWEACIGALLKTYYQPEKASPPTRARK
jgi:glycosyltransferase involved in cell wall biosynthesis